MKVKLISYSKAADSGDQSIQDLVAYCARVSNPANQQNTETNEKLINRILELEIKRISSPDGNGNPRILASIFS